jgi:hypothetical protein
MNLVKVYKWEIFLFLKAVDALYGHIRLNCNRGKKVNWKEYENDFILRTDAVWEKTKLKDYFRSYSKCFWFDIPLQRYTFIEPEEAYTLIFEGSSLEDFQTYPGSTPTGRTNCYQHGNPPKQRVAVSSQTNAVFLDYYNLCALRFEKWWGCDMVYHDIRHKYDYNLDQTKWKSYPCFRYFYEAQYACTDDYFDFLMELAYAKTASDKFMADHSNAEIAAFPTVFDTPKKIDRKTYTY